MDEVADPEDIAIPRPGRDSTTSFAGRHATNKSRALRGLALYALAFAFLGLVLWRTRVWEMGDSLGQVNPFTLTLIPLFSVVISRPLAIRQRFILNALGQRFSAWRLVPISYYGNTVGFLTPFSSGEILRPTLFQRGLDLPLSQGVAVVLYERLYSSFLLGVVGLLALTWTGILPWMISAVLVPLILTASALPPLAYWAARSFGVRLPLSRLKRLVPGRLRDRLLDASRESGTTLSQLFLSPRLAVSFCLTTYLTFLIMAAQFWVLVHEVTPGVSLSEAWVILVTSNVVGILSGLPLGLGVTDAVMVSLLGVYGVGVPASATVVILMRGLINLPTGILGLLAYLTALRQRPAPALQSIPTVSGE